MADDPLDNPPKPLRSLAEELKASIHSRPDPNTLAWWERRFQEILQAYKGASHSINLSVANTRDNEARLKTFSDLLNEFRSEILNMRADIGGLLSEVTLLREENAAYRARIEAWAKNIETWAVSKGKSPQPKENTNAG